MSAVEDIGYGISLSGQDPASIGAAMRALVGGAAADPVRLARVWSGYALTQARVVGAVAQGCLGMASEPVATPEAGDRRFADRAWQENPVLRAALESHLVRSDFWQDLVEQVELPAATRLKARFGVRLMLDALAPSNLPWLNPAVWKEAIDTGGLSLARGFLNFADDALHNGGRPRQVDRGPFEVGRNLAATPGRVVLRNELVELLAYEPQTEETFEVPLLCSPPWINRYYVMDLAPGRSFIEYAVRHGFRVFCLSYRNPDASMANLTMGDYLRLGPLAALDRVAEITGAPSCNLFGLCLGGSYVGILLGWLAAHGQADRVGCAALTNTLLDFSEPGELGVFTDEASVARLEKQIRKRGYLEAGSLQRTFDWLRGNDLVWSYVISNWYMGRKPPAFDILAWNSDGTNLPAAMHIEYLRSCYLANRLANGTLEIEGTPIDLGQVRTPLYVIGAEADHIAPWRGTYRSTQLVGGEARFTLTSSGHIAGIVNPPGQPKSRYWTRDDCPPDPEEWRSGAVERPGSWWEHWLAWASERSGAMVRPGRMAAGEPAPGRYVRGQLGPPVPARPRRRAAATRPRVNGRRPPATPGSRSEEERDG